MKTLQQRVGGIIARARVRQGIRADVANDTAAMFGESLTALRGELGDDALLEWVLRETIAEIDGTNEVEAEEERMVKQRFSKFLDYDDKPAAPVLNSKFFE